MHKRFLVAAFALLIDGGCASDASSTPDANDELVDVFVFTFNDQCRAALRGGAVAGANCTLPDDCAEVCCSCDAMVRSFSAQACVAGKCTTEAGTCARAKQETAICNDLSYVR